MQLRLDEAKRVDQRPRAGAFWDGDAATFINNGVNGRWADTQTAEESVEYEAHAERELGKDCACWLTTGEI